MISYYSFLLNYSEDLGQDDSQMEWKYIAEAGGCGWRASGSGLCGIWRRTVRRMTLDPVMEASISPPGVASSGA